MPHWTSRQLHATQHSTNRTSWRFDVASSWMWTSHQRVLVDPQHTGVRGQGEALGGPQAHSMTEPRFATNDASLCDSPNKKPRKKFPRTIEWITGQRQKEEAMFGRVIDQLARLRTMTPGISPNLSQERGGTVEQIRQSAAFSTAWGRSCSCVTGFARHCVTSGTKELKNTSEAVRMVAILRHMCTIASRRTCTCTGPSRLVHCKCGLRGSFYVLILRLPKNPRRTYNIIHGNLCQ